MLFRGPFSVLLLASFISCTAHHDPVNEEALDSVAQGKLLYQTHCSECHGRLPYPDLSSPFANKQFASIADIKSAIASNRGGMGKFQNSLSDSDVELISLALSSVDEKLIEIKEGGESKAVVPLGTKMYMASSLKTFFINEEQPTSDDTEMLSLVENLVVKNVNFFGGPCSRYHEDCDPGHESGSTASMNPNPDVIRKGYTSRVCSEILNYDRAVVNFLRQINLSESSPINENDIDMILAFVFPGRVPPPNVKDSLVTLVSVANQESSLSSIDRWRFLILPLCISSAFEMI